MKYNYDKEQECFVREDGLGKRIWINNSEGLRIMTLWNLGNSISEIRNKIMFNSRKVSESTITSFIDNVRANNIVLDNTDYVPISEDLSIEHRIKLLEEKVGRLEEKELPTVECSCDCDSVSLMDKLRSIF